MKKKKLKNTPKNKVYLKKVVSRAKDYGTFF